MGIGMEGVGLERGLVFEQAIEDVHRFPDTAGNEVAEQRDIGITDMVGGLSQRPNYAKEFAHIQF